MANNTQLLGTLVVDGAGVQLVHWSLTGRVYSEKGTGQG